MSVFSRYRKTFAKDLKALISDLNLPDFNFSDPFPEDENYSLVRILVTQEFPQSGERQIGSFWFGVQDHPTKRRQRFIFALAIENPNGNQEFPYLVQVEETNENIPYPDKFEWFLPSEERTQELQYEELRDSIAPNIIRDYLTKYPVR